MFNLGYLGYFVSLLIPVILIHELYKSVSIMMGAVRLRDW